MARQIQKKLKTKEIIVKLEHARDVFSTIWPFAAREEPVELRGVQDVRHLLSNEKARILVMVKTRQPSSIYELAKLLERDFKSVRQDVKLLEKFGLISLVPGQGKNKKRKALKPVLAVNELNIVLKI